MNSDATVDLILAEEGRLRRLARRFARCEADVDDLVQETLLRAYRARDRFIPGTSIRAWTSTILRRVFLTDATRAKRRATENDTDAGDALEQVAGASKSAHDETSPSYEQISEMLDDPMKRALDRVSQVYREPLLLAAVKDLSCREIARVLSVPEGTVMSRIHRARQRVKLELFNGGSRSRARRSGRFAAA